MTCFFSVLIRLMSRLSSAPSVTRPLANTRCAWLLDSPSAARRRLSRSGAVRSARTPGVASNSLRIASSSSTSGGGKSIRTEASLSSSGISTTGMVTIMLLCVYLSFWARLRSLRTMRGWRSQH